MIAAVPVVDSLGTRILKDIDGEYAELYRVVTDRREIALAGSGAIITDSPDALRRAIDQIKKTPPGMTAVAPTNLDRLAGLAVRHMETDTNRYTRDYGYRKNKAEYIADIMRKDSSVDPDTLPKKKGGDSPVTYWGNYEAKYEHIGDYSKQQFIGIKRSLSVDKDTPEAQLPKLAAKHGVIEVPHIALVEDGRKVEPLDASTVAFIQDGKTYVEHNPKRAQRIMKTRLTRERNAAKGGPKAERLNTRDYVLTIRYALWSVIRDRAPEVYRFVTNYGQTVRDGATLDQILDYDVKRAITVITELGSEAACREQLCEGVLQHTEACEKRLRGQSSVGDWYFEWAYAQIELYEKEQKKAKRKNGRVRKKAA